MNDPRLPTVRESIVINVMLLAILAFVLWYGLHLVYGII